MAAIFFTSYSRLNVKAPKDRDLVRKFVDELAVEVEQKLGAAPQPVSFFDTTDIETGDDWNDDLSTAAASSSVAICLFSPSYFTSTWCAREFQAFLDRRQLAPRTPGVKPPKAIIPVLWMKAPLPPPASPYQSAHDALPMDYQQLGLRGVMSLKIYQDVYTIALSAIADLVVNAFQGTPLPELPGLDLRRAPAPWGERSAPESQTHKAGAVTKACFVYLSSSGWNWRPYTDPAQPVGAFAQQLAGELGLQYEELPCSARLPDKLTETNENAVPTLLISDPSSVTEPTIRQVMRAYDKQYLLNCGVLVPWDRGRDPESLDPRWTTLATELCPQKTLSPPPNHEWRSIFSPEDLKARAVATVESIRMRLLQRILAAAPDARETAPQGGGADAGTAGAVSVSTVHDAPAEAHAAAHGIPVQTRPVVTNVSA